jgi:hypothetical protein
VDYVVSTVVESFRKFSHRYLCLLEVHNIDVVCVEIRQEGFKFVIAYRC